MEKNEPKCPICNSSGRFSFLGRDLLYKKNGTYRYLKCELCEAVYQSPMPTSDEISSFYPSDYAPYEQLGALKQPSQLKFAVLKKRYGYTHLNVSKFCQLISPAFAGFKYRDSISFIPNGRGLDVGCGNGELIRNMNSFGWNFEGVEFNSEAVAACRSIGINVFHGDLFEAAFEDNSFDLITARHLIEHIPDPNAFLHEVSRILKRGGRLVIETPNSKALGRKWFGTNWFADEVPRHLILYCSKNLNKLTQTHGFQLANVKLFTSPKIILNSWDYLTGNCGKPSKKRKLRRMVAKLYIILATLSRRGDIIFATFEKL